VDTASGERVEHHMDQLYGRLFIGGELGPHGDGTLEPYANFAVSMIAYGYFDDVQITAGDAASELLVSQHEMGVGWSAGAGVNLNFSRFGVTGGARYLRQFGTPLQLGNGAVRVEPAYMQYRIGVTMPFPAIREAPRTPILTGSAAFMWRSSPTVGFPASGVRQPARPNASRIGRLRR